MIIKTNDLKENKYETRKASRLISFQDDIGRSCVGAEAGHKAHKAHTWGKEAHSLLLSEESAPNPGSSAKTKRG